jgi:hypothetical protein
LSTIKEKAIMPARVHTYFFGRLNLLGARDDKHRFLYDALKADIYETKGKFKYGFFETREVVHEENLFAFGSLVKYKPLLEGEIVDEDTHRLVEDGLPYGVIARSEFFFHYRTAVIAYRPITNRLSATQFREITARLIESAHDNFFVSAEIESVDEDLEIREAVGKFETISKISFDLHPSNPSLRPIWRAVDERLKALEARRLRETVEAREDGFNKDILMNDDAFGGLIMAADGYGKGRVEGVLDGRKVTISTEDSPVKKEVIPSDDPVDLLSQLMPTFRRIWERMVK